MELARACAVRAPAHPGSSPCWHKEVGKDGCRGRAEGCMQGWMERVVRVRQRNRDERNRSIKMQRDGEKLFCLIKRGRRMRMFFFVDAYPQPTAIRTDRRVTTQEHQNKRTPTRGHFLSPSASGPQPREAGKCGGQPAATWITAPVNPLSTAMPPPAHAYRAQP